MPDIRYSLIPHGNGSSELFKIDFQAVNLPLTIGRNNAIKIKSSSSFCPPSSDNMNDKTKYYSYVSRNHFVLTLEGGSICLRCMTTQDGLPSVNGVIVRNQQVVVIKAGDVIALLGNIKMYEYKFVVESENVKPSSPFANSRLPVLSLDRRLNELVAADPRPFHRHTGANQVDLIDLSIVTPLSQGQTRLSETKHSSPFEKASQQGSLKISPSPSSSSSSSDVKVIRSSLASKVMNSSSSSLLSAAAINSAESKANDEKALNKYRDELLRQCECSVCMDILAMPHILVCGHSFCYTCIIDFAKSNPKCPICQSTFTVKDAYHNRHLADMIRELMKSDAQLTAWESRESSANIIKNASKPSDSTSTNVRTAPVAAAAATVASSSRPESSTGSIVSASSNAINPPTVDLSRADASFERGMNIRRYMDPHYRATRKRNREFRYSAPYDAGDDSGGFLIGSPDEDHMNRAMPLPAFMFNRPRSDPAGSFRAVQSPPSTTVIDLTSSSQL
jgi:hypothetical protein